MNDGPRALGSPLPAVTHLTFVWGSINSGGFTCLKDLVIGQAAIGMDVEVMALVYRHDADAADELLSWRDHGVTVTLVDFSRGGRRDDLTVVRRLVAHMLSRRGRIIHHSDGKYVGVLAARLAGNAKTVVTYHHTLPRAFTPYSTRLKRLVDPLVERYIAVSQTVFDYLVGEIGIDPSRVDKINNGLDCSTPLPGRKPLRQRFGIDENDFVVGFVGRLEKEKNIGLLLEAAKGRPDMVFVIVGDGAQRAALEAVKDRERLGNVRFLGNRPEAPLMPPLFDIFCLPSRSEACPMTILEALRASLPVLANDVGEIAAMLENGRYGVCVPLTSAERIATELAIMRRHYPRYQRMAAAGALAVRRRYSPDRVVRDTVGVYLRAGRREPGGGAGEALVKPAVFAVLRHAQKAMLMGHRNRRLSRALAFAGYVRAQARLLRWRYAEKTPVP